MKIEFEELMQLDDKEGLKLDGVQKADLLAQLSDPENDLLVEMVQAGVIPRTAGNNPANNNCQPLIELTPIIPLDKALGADGVIRNLYSVGVHSQGGVFYVDEKESRDVHGLGVVYSSDNGGSFLGQTTILGNVTMDQYRIIADRTSQILIEIAEERDRQPALTKI